MLHALLPLTERSGDRDSPPQVDDLREVADLEVHVERSQSVLVYATGGYFKSRNCLREMRAATALSKPIIALVDPDATRGGLSQSEILSQLCQGWYDKQGGWQPVEQTYASWGFEPMPTCAELAEALFAGEVIEWNRLRAFQDVTVRLISERLLPDSFRGVTYLEGELPHSTCAPMLPEPCTARTGCEFHIFVSELNQGAEALVGELNATLRQPAVCTAALPQLSKCACCLVYLHDQTWSDPRTGVGLGEDLLHAIEQRLPLLLAYECIGAHGQDERHGCEFDSFFQCTPNELLHRGVYDRLAVPLKGGPWRPTSLRMLASELICLLDADSSAPRWSFKARRSLKALLGAGQKRTRGVSKRLIKRSLEDDAGLELRSGLSSSELPKPQADTDGDTADDAAGGR